MLKKADMPPPRSSTPRTPKRLPEPLLMFLLAEPVGLLMLRSTRPYRVTLDWAEAAPAMVARAAKAISDFFIATIS